MAVAVGGLPPYDGLETDLDDESFRSDLERDSAHSSLVNQVEQQLQYLSCIHYGVFGY